MFPQALDHLERQVQARERRIIRLDEFDDAQALRVVVEAAAARHQAVQRFLARMPEGRVAEIVRQRDSLGQVLVERERPRDGPAHRGDLDRVRKPGAQMVAGAVEENLRLVLQPPEGAGVDHAGAVALKVRAVGVARLRVRAARGIRARLRVGGQHPALVQFHLLAAFAHGVGQRARCRKPRGGRRSRRGSASRLPTRQPPIRRERSRRAGEWRGRRANRRG